MDCKNGKSTIEASEAILKRFLIITALIASMTAPVNAHTWARIEVQKNDSLSLKQCIEMAVFNAGAARRAYMNYEMATNSVGIAKSAFIPTLSAGVGLNVTDNSHLNNGKTSRTFPSIQATLNQLIWDFGKTSALIRMSKFNKIMAKFQMDELLNSIIYETKTVYYGVLASKSYVDVEKANVQINLRDYTRTKAFFDEGIRSKVDIVNSEYNLAQARMSLIDAETTYQTSWVTLNRKMSFLNPPEYEIENTETFNLADNYYPASFLAASENGSTDSNIDVAYKSSVTKSDIIGEYQFEKFPYTFEEAVEFAYKNRHDMQALEASLSAMNEELKYIKRQYYPSLTGNLGYGFTDTRATSSNNSYTLGVNLNSSINIKKVKHEIDNAKLQVGYVESEIGSRRLAIFCEVQDAYIRTMQLEKQIPLAEVKVRQALENLELSEGRYEVGVGDFIELQDAKVNYTNACNSYVKVVYDYNIARATLESVMCLHEDFFSQMEDKKQGKKTKKKKNDNDE